MTGERHPIRRGAGPRAVEAALLRDLRPRIRPDLGDPARLASPVRIVVPSRSLREHLSARVVAEFGAVAGLSIRTLHSLALEIATRAGAATPICPEWFAVAVRRRAREEPSLRDGFEAFVDGYGPVEASVTDLLDAGFEPPHAEILDERILAAGAADVEVERARALVRVASWTATEVAEGRLGHRVRLFRAARERIERDPAGALPCRALFVHGFADATGIVADLIEALVRLCGARVLLDRPPDPASPEGVVEAAFVRRFGERLERAAEGAEDGPDAGAPPRVVVLKAPGPQAEARAVAERIRSLLDAGAPAERIGVVARSLDDYAVPLRRHFGRLGIPFSALGAVGPPDAAGRRLGALLDLLARGERTPAERWLDLWDRLPGPDPVPDVLRADLGLALHARGAGRVADVASLVIDEPADRATLRLPVRAGLREDEDRGSIELTRRRLRRERLQEAIDAAGAVVRRLERWPAKASLAEHRERLRRLVDEDLAWRPDTPGRQALDSALFARWAGLPGALELGRDDFALLMARALERAGAARLGGEGAGVQVLNVMEARARTFEHLFVLGLSRGRFPRPVTEDPLLSDTLRRQLRDVLPDLPVKSEGHDEERFLFAQLVSSSPEVTLACPVTDDDGKAQPLSPLVERLDGDEGRIAVEEVPSLHAAPRPGDAEAPRPAHEHALLSGLHGSRGRFERVLAIALDEAAGEAGGGAEDPPGGRARARCAVLAELDPPLRRPRPPGPYFGFTGEPPGGTGGAAPFVTVLERIAGCPWQAFLTRGLGLELPPDALAALPGVDARVLGSVVHAVLEAIAKEAPGEPAEDLAAARQRAAVAVRWPETEALEALVQRCAREVLRDEGVSLPGFARVLARHARERLEVARRVDWPTPESAVPVLGAELTGSVTLRDARGRERALRFRADRVDAGDGGLRLTDYKSGRAHITQKGDSVRERHYRERVASGELLQAAAYARAGGELAASSGRYLFLHPDTADAVRSFEVASDDETFREAFEGAVRALLEVWDRGAFFPRLVDAKGDEPGRCSRCEVKDACLRGDSGARRRLATWAATAGDAAGALGPAEQALLAAWTLGAGS